MPKRKVAKLAGVNLASLYKVINELKPLKKTGDRVFPYHPVNIAKIIKKLYNKAGIKGYTAHTLRHTFASYLVMSGVDISTIKELLGHSKIETTMIYSHLSSEHLKKAVEKLTNL